MKILSEKVVPSKHYLIESNYSECETAFVGIIDTIKNYMPESKNIYEQSMEFYGEYMRYFVKLDKLEEVFRHDNVTILIMKQISADYSTFLQGNADGTGKGKIVLFLHITDLHEILHTLMEV